MLHRTQGQESGQSPEPHPPPSELTRLAIPGRMAGRFYSPYVFPGNMTALLPWDTGLLVSGKVPKLGCLPDIDLFKRLGIGRADAFPLATVDLLHPFQALDSFWELAAMGHAGAHLGLVHLAHVYEDSGLAVS